MKKWLSLLLAALLLLGMVSCSGKEDPPAETTPSGGTGGSSGNNGEPGSGLQAEDFGDENGAPRDFNILARNGRYDYLYVEKDSSDRVDHAVFLRNTKLNETFNINIKITASTTETAAWWSNALATSSGEYDLIVPDYWWGIEQSGYVTNILELNEIDPSDPWWYQGWNENATVNNRLYNIVGDAALEVLENLEAVFFNTDRANSLNVNFYTMVDERTWTLNNMLTYARLAASNLDGSNPSSPVVYGALYDRHSMPAQLHAMGVKMIEMDDAGMPTVIAGSQIYSDITDVLTDFIQDDAVRYDDNTARATANQNPTIFRSGNALFFSSALYLGTGLKGTEVKYGILPQPLYAEGDNYTSTLYGVSFFCIPKSVKDLHCSAVVLNAMNYLSNPDNDLGNESLTYQYYDTIVMGQVAQQPDDARMLELIRDSVYVDFAFMYDANLKLYTQFFNAVKNDSSITTLLGTIENSLPEALAKLIEAYQK